MNLWIRVKDELPADDLRVLLCDIRGYVTIGTRDEYGYADDHCMKLEDIECWAYIPSNPNWGRICNDKFVEALAKQGLLDK